MALKKPMGRTAFAEVQSKAGAIRLQKFTDVATASAAAILSAQATSNSVITTVVSFLAQPDFARNIVITPGGTTGDVPAGDIVVTGTNIRGQVISETFTLTADQSSASTGSKAFKTITSIVFPVQDGAAATYNVGTGVKLGLDRKMSVASVLDAYVDGVRETTMPTVAFSATLISGNTVITNTAPNGSRDFTIAFITPEITNYKQTTA
ncbi:hypothetical protein ACWFRF_15500 [Nocardia sp. NPDC055165]